MPKEEIFKHKSDGTLMLHRHLSKKEQKELKLNVKKFITRKEMSLAEIFYTEDYQIEFIKCELSPDDELTIFFGYYGHIHLRSEIWRKLAKTLSSKAECKEIKNVR